MMSVNLTDGSNLDVEKIAWVQRQGDGILLSYRTHDDDECEEMFFSKENATRIMALVEGSVVDPDDMTPDDVAHIEHSGMTFLEMLNFFRRGR